MFVLSIFGYRCHPIAESSSHWPSKCRTQNQVGGLLSTGQVVARVVVGQKTNSSKNKTPICRIVWLTQPVDIAPPPNVNRRSQVHQASVADSALQIGP